MVCPSRSLSYLFSLLPPTTTTRTTVAAPLVLIDGTALMFRSFFAMPPLTRPDPVTNEIRDVGALVGFMNTLNSLLLPIPESAPPPTCLVLFDSKGPTFRDDICESYKAQRAPPPEQLGPQFDLALSACSALGFPTFSAPGYEADDIIATMASIAGSNGRPVAIVGSDKDFMQLVTDSCVMVCPAKKKLFTKVEVEAKFGVPPRLMVDLQSLCGDATDNIKGIPSIGPKTAAELLLQFGCLDAVLENAHLVKQPKRRAVLCEHADSARLAKRLVTLRQDVPPVSLFPPLRDGTELEAILSAPTPPNFPGAIAFCEDNHLWNVAKALRRHSPLG